jgi:sodium-dependent dicarboxylate transporter 2/3/5
VTPALPSPAPGQSVPEGQSPGARAVRLAGGAAAYALVLALPLPGLTLEAHRLAAIFAWAVVYWTTEALPLGLTALLASTLAIALGVAPARTVLAPYADPVIFVFLGSFVLAEAMKTTGLDRRLAGALLGRPWATRTPGRLLATVGAITCGISLWVSNTATTAMMLPIGTGLLRELGRAGDRGTSRYPIGLLLMLTWGSSVAIGIPVGSPPNLIAIGLVRELTGRRLTFFDWAALTMPATVAMLAVSWGLLRWLYREPPGSGQTTRIDRATTPASPEPWTVAQLSVAAVFGVAATLWMLPGAVAVVTSPEAPAARWLEARLPESAVALGAAVALFCLPAGLDRGVEATAWKRMATIDWGTILLFGGGLSLGRLMFETGLAEAAGRALVRVTGAESVWALTGVAIVAGVVLSELTSNTASASMLVPVVIAIAQTTGASPLPPALGAALGASFGFMLPISTPPNAIVYGSGLVPLSEMVRAGFLLDVAGAAIIWLSLRLLCPLLGVM